MQVLLAFFVDSEFSYLWMGPSKLIGNLGIGMLIE
jgi:hypothetical protein